jgi:galactokinase
MTNEFTQKLHVSTPGRICLFGEHQDYLSLPVIPAAISLRVSIEGRRNRTQQMTIELPDIASRISFSLNGMLNYVTERDYFRSAVNVMRKNGYTFSFGIDCIVRGDIPINAGTSSSSALVVTWINFLAQMSDQGTPLPAEDCARLAHVAEVVEFNEPGGMMDQYSTAFGGILFLKFSPTIQFERLSVSLSSFVLGDSGTPKNTKFILSHVKNRVFDIINTLTAHYPKLSLQTITVGEIDRFGGLLTPEQQSLLLGTLRNRDITHEAYALFHQKVIDEHGFGRLLNEHQTILRDILHISTPKINTMLDAALEAGAYGGKINGSGGGGCMFVYAPENPEQVAEAIRAANGTPYIVQIDDGTRNEQSPLNHE